MMHSELLTLCGLEGSISEPARFVALAVSGLTAVLLGGRELMQSLQAGASDQQSGDLVTVAPHAAVACVQAGVGWGSTASAIWPGCVAASWADSTAMVCTC
jgi:hypothetical protein